MNSDFSMVILNKQIILKSENHIHKTTHSICSSSNWSSKLIFTGKFISRSSQRIFVLFNFQSYSDAAQTRYDTPTGFNIWSEFLFIFSSYFFSLVAPHSVLTCAKTINKCRNFAARFMIFSRVSSAARLEGDSDERREKKWEFAVFCTKLECLK